MAKGETIAASLKKRFRRLMIPYLFVGLCYAPMKYMLSSFANKPYDFSQIWQIVIGNNPDGELWFLYALFVITVIACLARYRISKLGLLFLAALAMLAPSLAIVTANMLYFFLGIWVRREHPDFVKRINMPVLLCTCAVFAAINAWSILYGGNSLFRILTSVSGIVLCLRFSQWIDGRAGIVRDWLV